MYNNPDNDLHRNKIPEWRRPTKERIASVVSRVRRKKAENIANDTANVRATVPGDLALAMQDSELLSIPAQNERGVEAPFGEIPGAEISLTVSLARSDIAESALAEAGADDVEQAPEQQQNSPDRESDLISAPATPMPDTPLGELSPSASVSMSKLIKIRISHR
jgi:hypothetical protein